MINRWVSLDLTLDEMTDKGVKFRLSSDTQTMQYKAPAGVLETWQEEHLNYCRQEFTEALRRRAGLCILCGMEAAKRPSPKGRFPAFDPETGRKTGKWIRAEVQDYLKDKYAPLFCDACWDTGGMEQWAGLTTGRIKSAKSGYAGRRDRAEEIVFPDEDGEGTVTQDTEADLFAGY